MQTEGKNYYEILGLERDADMEQIRAAYKEIARIYHPDSNFYGDIVQSGVSEQQMTFFKTLTAAYHTLSNQDKRLAYDNSLPPLLRGWDADGNIFESPLRDEPLEYTRAQSSSTRSGAYGIFGVSADASPLSAIDKETMREVEFRSGIFTRKITFWEKLKILLGFSKYTSR